MQTEKTYELNPERAGVETLELQPLQEATASLAARQFAEKANTGVGFKTTPEAVSGPPATMPKVSPSKEAISSEGIALAAKLLAFAAAALFGLYLLYELAVGIAVGIRSMGERIGDAVATTIGTLAIWAIYFFGGLVALWAVTAWLKTIFASKPAEDYPIFERSDALPGNQTLAKGRRVVHTFEEIVE